MKQLTILRHAKSSRKDTSLPDFERPLNGRGRGDAPRMGEWLSRRGCIPDLVVASPALRARATAEAVMAALGLPPEKLQLREEIYEASAGTLLDVLRSLPESARHVLLVGHNPGLTELWNRLSPVATDNIPTCGAYSVQLPAAAWPEAGRDKGEPLFTAVPKAIAGV
jgi:phosphohistidine phosphatase